MKPPSAVFNLQPSWPLFIHIQLEFVETLQRLRCIPFVGVRKVQRGSLTPSWRAAASLGKGIKHKTLPFSASLLRWRMRY